MGGARSGRGNFTTGASIGRTFEPNQEHAFATDAEFGFSTAVNALIDSTLV
jgi:hypothetical protein